MLRLSQTRLLLLTVFAAGLGVLLGAVYDLFRIRRVAFAPHERLEVRLPFRIRRTSDSAREKERNGAVRRFFRTVYRMQDWIFVFFEDLFFALLAAAAVNIFIYQFNGGVVRWFLLAGMAVGFAIYQMTVGRLVMACSACIAAALRWLLHGLFRITLWPLLWVGRWFIGRIGKRLIHAWEVHTDHAERRHLLREADAGFDLLTGVQPEK